MAEAATPSAVTMSTLDAGADPSKASNDKSTAKPTRPDETAFREAEAKLRSQLEAAQKKTVCHAQLSWRETQADPS